MIQLQHGDCLELMKDIPDGSIDMILCDLPYGTSACKWDAVIPFDLLWSQYIRISNPNTAIVLFGREPFTSTMIMSNIKMYRQKLTWLKTRPTNVFNAKKQFMNWTEDITVFYRKLPTFNPQFWDDGTEVKRKIQHLNTDRSKGTLGQTGEREGFVSVWGGDHRYPKSVLEFSNVHHGSELFHPTQKPVELLEYLIKTYTNEGDTVLDNCMGSGSTGVACVNLNRNFIGMELKEEYFDIAQERIHKAQTEPKQMTLFEEEDE